MGQSCQRQRVDHVLETSGMVRQVKKSVPRFIEPMAAKAVNALPTGPDWTYEVKFDGYRGQIVRDGATVRLLSRNNKPYTYPSIISAAQRLKATQAVIDGEVAALDANGRPSFQALQNHSQRSPEPIVFFAFDLLHLDGTDLIDEPLVTRREKLLSLITPESTPLIVSASLPGSVSDVLNTVASLGLEGVVAKQITSRYVPGDRSDRWQKYRIDVRQEFVVGGFRPDGAASVDALLVGYYERRQLRYAAKVRGGLNPYSRRRLRDSLRPLEAQVCPFSNLPTEGRSRWGGGVTATEMAEMTWVRPHLVVEVQFREWTEENRLRHAKFLGIRVDKPAKRVVKEG